MKKFRKLIPATAMLLISALLMGTSTFAWFSLNKTVSATGMQIKASVPTQLLIKGSDDDANYKNAISFVDAVDSKNHATNATLLSVPATAYKARSVAKTAALIDTEGNWKKLVNNAYSKVDVNGQVSGAEAVLNTADYQSAVANEDYIKDQFTLKLVGAPNGTNDQVKAKIVATMTGNDLGETESKTQVSPIYKAVHIAFSDGTNIYEVDLGDGVVTYEADGSKAYVTVQDVRLTDMTTNNQEVKYNLYIWYDGEDADCKNSNAARIDQFTYDFTFDYGA